jgi:hypothetical protein
MGVGDVAEAVAVAVVVQDMVDCLGGRPLEGRDGIDYSRLAQATQDGRREATSTSRLSLARLGCLAGFSRVKLQRAILLSLYLTTQLQRKR